MSTIDATLLSLAGSWQGQGHVLNAAGETVAKYSEEATFNAVRKTDSFVLYRHLQETQHTTAGKPMHTETGFLKLATDGTAVGSFAHPFPSGFVQEMSLGSWEKINRDGETDTFQVTLQAKDFQRAVMNPPVNEKKQVHGFKRVYTLQGNDKLSYKQFLSTTEGGDNHYHHLSCSFMKK